MDLVTLDLSFISLLQAMATIPTLLFPAHCSDQLAASMGPSQLVWVLFRGVVGSTEGVWVYSSPENSIKMLPVQCVGWFLLLGILPPWHLSPQVA